MQGEGDIVVLSPHCKTSRLTLIPANHTDTYRHKGLRKQLAQILREKGIKDTDVLKAIETIPRHLFIPDNALHKFAYEDKPFPIGSKQTISQPYTVAFQTETLAIKKRERSHHKSQSLQMSHYF